MARQECHESVQLPFENICIRVKVIKLRITSVIVGVSLFAQGIQTRATLLVIWSYGATLHERDWDVEDLFCKAQPRLKETNVLTAPTHAD